MKMFSQWRGQSSKPNTSPMAKSFGVSLSDAPRGVDSGKIPIVLEKMITHLHETALDTEGLFRISGSLTAINELIKALDAGQEVNLNHQDQHTIAGLLKRFFRDLPDPLIPVEINQRIASLFSAPDGRKASEEDIRHNMREHLFTLPEVHFEVLKSMMGLLADLIKHSDRNKMTLQNIAICIVPSLDCVPAIVTYSLQNFDYFFKEPFKAQRYSVVVDNGADIIPPTPPLPDDQPVQPPTSPPTPMPAVEKTIPTIPTIPTMNVSVIEATEVTIPELPKEDKHKDKKDKKRGAHKRSRDKDDRHSYGKNMQERYERDITELQSDILREKEKYDYYTNKTGELEHRLKKEEEYTRTLLSDYERIESKLRKMREEYNSTTSINGDEHKHRPKTPRS